MTGAPLPESDSTTGSDATLLAELFDYSPVPLVVTSLVRDCILAVNRRSEEVFGLRGSDAIGGSVTAFYSDPEDRQIILRAIRETGRLTNHPLQLRHPNGSIVFVLFNSRRIVWEGEPAILGAFVDLTALRQAEQALDHARQLAEESRDKLDHELASAGHMQRAILPRSLPQHRHVSFAATYQTSRHAGGDYYDVIQIDPNRFALVVVDVSGHGARAAIVMAMIRAVIHTWPCGMADPACVLQHLNCHFEFLWETSMFATAVVGVLDTESRVLRLSSAGHPPPLLIRGGQVTELPVTNAPLLLWERIDDPPVHDFTLEPGDRVVLYTDGITDRCGPHDSRFDLERVTQSFSRNSALDMTTMLAELDRELEAFACTTEPDDDQTVLAVEIK